MGRNAKSLHMHLTSIAQKYNTLKNTKRFHHERMEILPTQSKISQHPKQDKMESPIMPGRQKTSQIETIDDEEPTQQSKISRTIQN